MTKNEGGADEDILLEDLPGDVEDGEEDKTDWKALAKKNHGMAKRFQTKLSKQKEKPEGGEGDGGKGGDGAGDDKKGVLSPVDRAVLRVEKISGKEVELVETFIKNTGKTLDEVLENKYFLAELKEMRDLAATDDATPENGKRGNGTGKDSVEYWLAAGKLPPMEQVELRRKVVNAKMKKEGSGSPFSSNPLQ